MREKELQEAFDKGLITEKCLKQLDRENDTTQTYVGGTMLMIKDAVGPQDIILESHYMFGPKNEDIEYCAHQFNLKMPGIAICQVTSPKVYKKLRDKIIDILGDEIECYVHELEIIGEDNVLATVEYQGE